MKCRCVSLIDIMDNEEVFVTIPCIDYKLFLSGARARLPPPGRVQSSLKAAEATACRSRCGDCRLAKCTR